LHQGTAWFPSSENQHLLMHCDYGAACIFSVPLHGQKPTVYCLLFFLLPPLRHTYSRPSSHKWQYYQTGSQQTGEGGLAASQERCSRINRTRL
jgi:hypothetical protein